MANPTVIKLQDGNVMPQLGLGVWQASNEEVITAIQKALEVGYRSIDTAAAYKNEEGVGKALKNASVNREELFITTKLWNDDHGYDEALRALDASLARLGFDCWSVDMEGYGRSTKDRDNNAPIAQGADDCFAAASYIQKLRGKRPLLVYGISSGALRAALFAERHPEMVARLALDAASMRELDAGGAAS